MAYNQNMYMPYQYSMPAYPQTQYVAPTQQPINGVIGVTGIEGARAYQMPPNSSMPLFDDDNDIVYIKKTDAAGYPTIRAFEFKEIKGGDGKGAADLSGYVSLEKFNELADRVNALALSVSKQGKENGNAK